MTAPTHRHRLLRRWEDLHVAAQVGLAAPLFVLLMWAGHVAFLSQPVGRGLAYGVFWGLLLTAAVVGASRSERARREARERRGGPGRPAP